MKRILMIAGLILVTSSLALGQMQDKKNNNNNAGTSDKVKQELIRLDRDWTAAELRDDKETVSKIVADDFKGTNPDGTVENKSQYMGALKATTDKDAADDYDVRVFGDMAIMTHRGTVTGTTNRQYRSTHVWMKRDGRWQIIAHHSSDIVQPKPTQ